MTTLTNIAPDQTTISLLYVIELVLKDNQHIFDLEKSTYLLQDILATNYVKIHVKEYHVHAPLFRNIATYVGLGLVAILWLYIVTKNRSLKNISPP